MVLVYIRSRRRAMSQSGHPALTCLPNGEVCGNSFGAAGQLQQWELETHTEGNLAYVTIRAATTGMFLSAKVGGAVTANSAKTVTDHEKWFLQNCPTGEADGCISLMSFHGKYLVNDCRFDCGKTVRADREQICDWTKWIIVDDPKAMTCKTAVGKVAIAGVYTAALFLPLFGAIGVVTVAKRSMVYGGSTNSYSVFVVNNKSGAGGDDDEGGRQRQQRRSSNNSIDFDEYLLKIPIRFKTEELSKSIGAGADAVASTATNLAMSTALSLSDTRNDTTLTPEEEEEMERRLLINKQQRMSSQ